MSLEDIGFYTLSDERAQNSSETTPLERCELLLTSRCNFKCPYCRGSQPGYHLTKDQGLEIVNLWMDEGLKNVRFSGGEPTLWAPLVDIVHACKTGGVERIAISSNGSADIELYQQLCDAGVNDFSISLDGACCAVGDTMAGGIPGIWNKVVANIKAISKFCYVTVGIVFTEENIDKAQEVIEFADSLGVADIRVISSAQYNRGVEALSNISQELLDRHPILKYRVENHRSNENIRGMTKDDSNKCKLVLDDMAITEGKHYPCIIYLREGGDAIGNVGPDMRQERKDWYQRHNSLEDKICSKNCLDVCVAFNNKAEEKQPCRRQQH